MNKSLLTKIAIVIVLLIAFIGYMVYTNWRSSHFTVASETFDVKNSIQAVTAEEYEEYNDFNSLKLADYYGLTKKANQTVSIPDLHRQIKIHKVWALPYQFYILYSINLKQSDKNLYDIPELNFSNLVLHSGSGKSVKLTVNDRTRVSSGIVYQHRLYRGITLRPSFVSGMDSYEKVIHSIDKITANHAALIWKGTESDHQKTAVPNLQVSADYNQNNSTYFSVPLQQKVHLGTGESITLKRFVADINENQLWFTMKPKNDKIDDIYLSISGLGYHFPSFASFQVNQKGNLFYLRLPRLTDIPKKPLSLQIKGISSITNHSIHFRIPGWDGNKTAMSHVKTKVAEMMGSPLYFEGYTNNFYGSQIGLKLNWKIPEKARGLSLVNLFPAKQLDEQIPDKKLRERIKSTLPTIVTIKNDRGKRPDRVRQNDFGVNNNQSKTMTLLLEKQFVKNTDHLSITVNNLPNYEKVNTEKVKINIPDTGGLSE